VVRLAHHERNISFNRVPSTSRRYAEGRRSVQNIETRADSKFRLGATLARFDNSQNVKLFERRQQRDAGRFLTEIVESETYDLKDFSYPPPE